MQGSDPYSFSRTFCLAGKCYSSQLAISKFAEEEGLEPPRRFQRPTVFKTATISPTWFILPFDSLSYQPSVLHPIHSLTHELDAAEVFPSVTCTYAGFEPALPNIPTMGVFPLDYHYRIFVPLPGFNCTTAIRDRDLDRTRTYNPQVRSLVR